jgi:uncharacterized protein
MSWIQTLEGFKFDLLRPSAAAMSAKTIAVCLSRKCRFGGHCKEFYSVAQHSCLVSDYVDLDYLKLPALLHDAHEVYSGFGDILRPAKQLVDGLTNGWIKSHEHAIDRAVAEYFGFPATWLYHKWVKLGDEKSLATEQRDLLSDPPEPWVALPAPWPQRIMPWSEAVAYTEFMSRLNKLTAKE